jgi:hypothetical protein
MSGPGAHSKLSASGADRWFHCPGSVAASAGLPDFSSPYADEGTTAHIICETALRNNWDAERAARAVAMTDTGVKADMVPAVQSYVDAVRAVPAVAMSIELRVNLADIDPRLFGTSDCALIGVDWSLHVFDYKHGAGKGVATEENRQLLYYALGTSMVLQPPQITSVHLHVIQPRYKGHADPHGHWETTPLRLAEFGAELKQAIARTDAPDAPRIPGPWCQFCKAKKTPRCPESAGWNMKQFSAPKAEHQFNPLAT